MIEIAYSDPAVQASIISAVGSIVASTIASIAAAMVGKRFLDQKRIVEKFRHALNDIKFVLAVEEEHTAKQGQKLIMRERARERGFTWTGKFTPSRIKPF